MKKLIFLMLFPVFLSGQTLTTSTSAKSDSVKANIFPVITIDFIGGTNDTIYFERKYAGSHPYFAIDSLWRPCPYRIVGTDSLTQNGTFIRRLDQPVRMQFLLVDYSRSLVRFRAAHTTLPARVYPHQWDENPKVRR